MSCSGWRKRKSSRAPRNGLSTTSWRYPKIQQNFIFLCPRPKMLHDRHEGQREMKERKKKRHYFQTYLLRNIIEIQGRTSPLANSNKKLGMIDSLSFFLCGRLCHRSDSSNREKNKGTHTRTHTHTQKKRENSVLWHQ